MNWIEYNRRKHDDHFGYIIHSKKFEDDKISVLPPTSLWSQLLNKQKKARTMHNLWDYGFF